MIQKPIGLFVKIMPYTIRLKTGEYVTSPSSIPQKVGNPFCFTRPQLKLFFLRWPVPPNGWLEGAVVEKLEVTGSKGINEAREEVLTTDV